MPSNSGSGVGAGAKFAGFLLAWIITMICAANFSDTRPYRTADTHGYTKVQMVSSTVWFPEFKGCGVLGLKAWYMEANNSEGKRVSFLVCGELFGGNSVVVR